MTEHSMTPEAATALRKPFPPESVGVLPKPYKRDSAKGNCKECGGYHGLPAAHLDFVGHAATTDRLLTVDPAWTWEFAEVDPATGFPSLRHSIDPEKNLWIRLTVCGVTRIGVGDGSSMKERIGDAIRNAAMRFGVALDLWAKENLVEFAQAAQSHRADPPPMPADANVAYLDTSSKLAKAMFASINEAGIGDPKAFMSEVVGRTITSSKELTQDEARRVLDHLPSKAGESA